MSMWYNSEMNLDAIIESFVSDIKFRTRKTYLKASDLKKTRTLMRKTWFAIRAKELGCPYLHWASGQLMFTASSDETSTSYQVHPKSSASLAIGSTIALWLEIHSFTYKKGSKAYDELTILNKEALEFAMNSRLKYYKIIGKYTNEAVGYCTSKGLGDLDNGDKPVKITKKEYDKN